MQVKEELMKGGIQNYSYLLGKLMLEFSEAKRIIIAQFLIIYIFELNLSQKRQRVNITDLNK